MNDTMKYRVNEVTIFYKWWLGAESNCRHEDFQSTALPTELPSQNFIYNLVRKKVSIHQCALIDEDKFKIK